MNSAPGQVDYSILIRGLSVRFRLPEGFGGQTVEVGGGLPIYESLNGPQPQEMCRLEINWTASF
jgi:hypothetical protein